MRRINNRTVEFTTDAEVRARDWFEEYLDAGHGIPWSAEMALRRMALTETPTNEFAVYLSDGTVRVRNGEIVRS